MSLPYLLLYHVYGKSVTPLRFLYIHALLPYLVSSFLLRQQATQRHSTTRTASTKQTVRYRLERSQQSSFNFQIYLQAHHIIMASSSTWECGRCNTRTDLQVRTCCGQPQGTEWEEVIYCSNCTDGPQSINTGGGACVRCNRWFTLNETTEMIPKGKKEKKEKKEKERKDDKKSKSDKKKSKSK